MESDLSKVPDHILISEIKRRAQGNRWVFEEMDGMDEVKIIKKYFDNQK